MIDEKLPFPTHRGMKPGTLTPIQERIATYIYTQHRGHERAILRQDAAKRLSDLLDVNLTARKLREHIAVMVRRGLPIGVTQIEPCGYFWIETEEERVMVRDPLLNMAFSTLVHARGFDKENIVAPLLAQLRAAGFGDDEPPNCDEETAATTRVYGDGEHPFEVGDTVFRADDLGSPRTITGRTIVNGKALLYVTGEGLGMEPLLPHTVWKPQES